MRAAVIAALLCLAHAAAADDKPWAAGVSDADQKAALALYKEGNVFFEQSEYKDALAKYQLALKKWDHPAVRYNAAVCLFQLDRAVEAYEYLESALRFGEAPLGHDLFVQANNYMKLLKAAVGELEVTCDQDHAKITLDGTPLVDCPRSGKRHLLAKSPHQLVAELKGYKTQTRELRIEPGKTSTLVIKLEPEDTKKLVRRWPRWMPWAITAGGAAAVGVGAGVWLNGKDGVNEYNHDCSLQTSPTQSYCFTSVAEQDKLARANHDLNLGGGLLVVGGVVLAAGITLVILNSPHEERTPIVTPVVGPDRVGVTLTGSW